MEESNNLIGVRPRLKKNVISYDKVKAFVATQVFKWVPKASKFGHTKQDLESEAHLVFLECLETYVGESKYSSHFFSFFTACLYNRFYEVCRICWYDKERKDPVGSAMSIDDCSFSGNVEILQPIASRLSEASGLVIEALNYMFTASQAELQESGIQGKGSHGFRSNARFCEILGEDPSKVNILQEVRKFITQE